MRRRFFKEGLLMAVWGKSCIFILLINQNSHKRLFIKSKSIDKRVILSAF